MRRTSALLAFAAVTCISGLAAANGRFPYANHLVVDPKDPTHLVVRTTYGIIQSFDAGTSWKWICEKAGGYGGVFDPAVDVTSTGRMLVGLFDGLSSSTDRGCTFATQPAPVAKEYVIDLVVEPKDPSHALALTSTGLGAAGFHVVVFQSLDAGAIWTQAGVDLPKDFNSETIEVAPSRTDRIYASGIVGVMPRQGIIEVSDDRGATWSRQNIDLMGGQAPYIGAVDPGNPDVVYARIDGTSDGTTRADHLMVSKDGAKTWTEIGGTNGDMFGFALSPDGTKIAFGGPKDGLMIASTSDYAFKQVSTIGVRCLRWTGAGLYACASDYPDNFTVGLSTDEGKSWKPLYRLAELQPLQCPGDAATSICADQWPLVQSTIGQDQDGGAEIGAEPTLTTPADSSSGCHCGFARPASAIAPFAALLALVGALARRKR